MTYDRAIGELRLYADGRSVGTCEFPGRTPVRIGPARIGHWNSIPFDPSQLPRNLQGRIDELAVFTRPLSPDAVLQLYEAGRPADGRRSARPSQELSVGER